MTGPGPLLLLVAGDAGHRRVLRPGLLAEGYRVFEAETGAASLDMAQTHNPEVVLLDLDLPDVRGLDVIHSLRAWMRTPIVALADPTRAPSEVEILDAGADDCLLRPYAMPSLLARLRVARRHAARAPDQPGEPVLHFGDIRVDPLRREVHRGDTPVHLTPHEFRLVTVLARNADRPVSHRQLLKEIWGPTRTQQTHYLRVCMVRLRQKLEVDPSRPRWLVTEVGVGYRMRTR